jgi:hypothetical protein
VEVIVSVAPGEGARIGDVADALVTMGLQDPQVLEAAGVITGTMPDAADLAPLLGVAGVEAVEESRTIDIGPPDAPVQ